MPVVIPGSLPAYDILKNEKIFVMEDARAYGQDIRPLEVCIVNLMPTKIETETQLIRMLANTPLQINIHLVHMRSHESRNTRQEHLDNFYLTFEDIRNRKFDGMIITGAPVENLPYEEVDYWDELVQLMEYSKRNVFSTLHICWGAQAALYHHFRLKRRFMDKKLFGVFKHSVTSAGGRLMRGFDDSFCAPHSRFTQIDKEEFEKVPGMRILAESEEAGVHISSISNRRQIFVQGHGEYDRETLKKEYERDLKKGINEIPVNYFKEDNPDGNIEVKWKSHSQLLFSNWLNYCVYQETPYIIEEMEPLIY
ncbi:homoserine O-acetyltransferase MetA [Gudongella sp. DL1XJH-153]|uniref:homoserine O-acetyltransferase MetA n=1 Tax=Gudongella sp. DL1XJH-153 TaxID=3409804 RepID=UPI003BB5B0F8